MYFRQGDEVVHVIHMLLYNIVTGKLTLISMKNYCFEDNYLKYDRVCTKNLFFMFRSDYPPLCIRPWPIQQFGRLKQL
jgi:hypothetical protein